MTITVTPTVEASNVPPRVRLNVAASAGETSTTVTRNSNGSTVPVRTQDGGPLPLSAGTGLIYDYEMPYGAALTFSSRESPTTVSASVTVDVSDVWLVHPGVPALSVKVALRPGTLLDEALAVKQSLSWPMGRSTPIVVSDGARKASQSTLVAMTQSLNDISAIRALVADAGVLLLNIPVGMAAGFDACYIAVADVKIARFTEIQIDSYRDVTLPFYVVDRPAGGTTALRTIADLSVYTTIGDIDARYPTLGDVLAGP